MSLKSKLRSCHVSATVCVSPENAGKTAERMYVIHVFHCLAFKLNADASCSVHN